MRAKLREKVEPKVKRLIEKVDENYCRDRCGIPFPSIPYVGEDYASANKKIFICGKGGGSWGLKDMEIRGWDENSSLQNVDLSGDWYREQLRIQTEFMIKVKDYLSGRKGGYSKGSWWRATHRVIGALLFGKPISSGWNYAKDGDPDFAEATLSSGAYSNLDKISVFGATPVPS